LHSLTLALALAHLAKRKRKKKMLKEEDAATFDILYSPSLAMSKREAEAREMVEIVTRFPPQFHDLRLISITEEHITCIAH